MKIISQIDDDTFVISLKNDDKKHGTSLKIAHDFIEFSGSSSIQSDFTKDLRLTGPHAWASNQISVPTYLQIGIKSAQQIILPLLNNHKYLQPEHLADREHDKDDEYWKINGLEGPRYKKGDKYPAYSYSTQVIFYYEEGKGQMVAFCKNGEKAFSHITLSFYNEYVLPTLNKK